MEIEGEPRPLHPYALDEDAQGACMTPMTLLVRKDSKFPQRRHMCVYSGMNTDILKEWNIQFSPQRATKVTQECQGQSKMEGSDANEQFIIEL